MAETLLEVMILTVVYYLVWREGYEMAVFAYKGKYVLMALYGALAYLIFQNADCTMFGQLNRVDLIIGQIISLLLVNAFTYVQLCLISNAVISPMPMIALCGIQTVIAIVLILVMLFTWSPKVKGMVQVAKAAIAEKLNLKKEAGNNG